jgi:hypothetical protein
MDDDLRTPPAGADDMRLDPELLEGPPETGARVLALARLADVEDALTRLLDAKDGGGARPLPGATQRLATALRVLAPALGGAVPSALLGEVEAAARAAAPGRDPETFAAWLAGARGELAAPYRGALDWLSDRADRRCRRAREELAAEAAPRLRRVLPRLHAALTGRRGAGRASVLPTFAGLLAQALRAQTRRVRDAVLAAAGPSDAAALEVIRGEARRLHELLEPLRQAEPAADAAARLLDGLRAPLEATLAAAAARGALEGALLEARAEEVRRGEPFPGLRPGLLALLRVAEQREAVARQELAAPLAGRATPLVDASYAAVAALGQPPQDELPQDEGAPPPAPERRFLVTEIPPEGLGGDVETLEQGWLPGEGRESVGVTRSALGEHWFRARAAARGRPGRVEPTSRSEFDDLWPLTEGRRIAKRRHLVPAAPGWHFDEYLDRPLVLAVGEEGNAEAPPPWLEPAVVREVSAERGYLDEALARRPARRSA